MKIGNLECYGYIYKIINIVNNKSYIGQTTQGFNKRYNCGGIGIERVYKYHKKLSNHKEWGFNNLLYNDIIKYGLKNFKVQLFIDFAFSKSELHIKEQLHISLSDSVENGYNKSTGGYGGKGVRKFGNKNPFYKKHHTDEVKKIISETHKGIGARKVFCITTNKLFNSVKDASIFYKCDSSGICKCCNNKREYNGVYKGLKLKWLYLDDYLKIKEAI